MARRNVPILTLTLLGTVATAQCGFVPQGFGSVPGVDGTIRAMTWRDPDGSGPAPAHLVVGGRFQVAGARLASGIAAWDPRTSTWQGLGQPAHTLYQDVSCIAVLPNNDLIIAGDLPATGQIRRWNGSAWSTFAPQLRSTTGSLVAIRSMAVDSAGNVYVGGSFDASGTVVGLNNLARWDGRTWTSVGGGVDSAVHTLAMAPNGTLFAGGHFNAAGGIPAALIAAWNGNTWSAMPGLDPLVLPANVDSMVVLGNTLLAVAGRFALAGGTSASRVAMWNGVTWTDAAAPTSITSIPPALTTNRGALLAAGYGGVYSLSAGSWIPTTSQSLGLVTAILSDAAGDLFVAGDRWAPGVVAAGVMRWRNGWSSLNPGTDVGVQRVIAQQDGSVVLAGTFRSFDGQPTTGLARLHQGTWSALPTPRSEFPSSVVHVPDQGLLATFPSTDLARWDGTNWHNLATIDGTVASACLRRDGSLVVGGRFQRINGVTMNNIAVLRGGEWSRLRTGTNDAVAAVVELPDSSLLVGGTFTSAGSMRASYVARWTGSEWLPVDHGMDRPVRFLLMLPEGHVLASGLFTRAGSVATGPLALLVGNRWRDAGINAVTAGPLALGPDGDVFALVTNGVAQRQAGSWIHYPGTSNPLAASLAVTGNGTVLLGGGFTLHQNVPATGLMTFAPRCPADARNLGFGCSLASTPLQLAATALPWQGTRFRTILSGAPPSSVAIAILGFSDPNQPLAALHSGGVPGCQLRASPDVAFAIPGITTEFGVPTMQGLVGLTFRHQVVVLDAPSTSGLRLASSDTLALLIGNL